MILHLINDRSILSEKLDGLGVTVFPDGRDCLSKSTGSEFPLPAGAFPCASFAILSGF